VPEADVFTSTTTAVDGNGHVAAERLRNRWPGAARSAPDRLDKICGYAISATGKLLRPTLLIECALAVGGVMRHVLPAAVGAECGHVASLVHDDIIDHDDVRRGQPSVHRRFGSDDAIVAGDALIFDLFAGLAECRDAGAADARVVSALATVARSGVDMCRGQLLEAQVTADRTFSIDAYLAVAGLKTAAFFRGVCETGAILGGGLVHETVALAFYGEHLGLAFQIRDDLLSFVADDAKTGKPGSSDLVNGRLTAPVVLAHLHANTKDRAHIEHLLSSVHDPAAGLRALRDVAERTGALRRASDLAHEYAGRAREALDALAPTPSRDRLCRYADAVIIRDK
jgi:geranylgeranyl diphosphate synthase type I